jgi:hypothetical protein
MDSKGCGSCRTNTLTIHSMQTSSTTRGHLQVHESCMGHGTLYEPPNMYKKCVKHAVDRKDIMSNNYGRFPFLIHFQYVNCAHGARIVP